MKNSYYLIILAASAFAVSSCNTFIGAGRDIQSLGAGMQNTGNGKTWEGQPQPAGVTADSPVGPAPAPSE